VTNLTGHILIVDDDEANRHLLSRRLLRAGYSVHAVDGGRAALDYLAATPVDMVMLDIQMPEMSGLDVLRIIRTNAATCQLPVVLVTAKALADDVATGYALGANDYITKPIDFASMLARLQAVLTASTDGGTA
jgi:DNA-binding response OmpR family regulator